MKDKRNSLEMIDFDGVTVEVYANYSAVAPELTHTISLSVCSETAWLSIEQAKKMRDELTILIGDQTRDIHDTKVYRSMLDEKLPDYVNMKGQAKSVSVILRNISEDMELPRKEVSCARYGKVWAYHVDVIAQFKEMYL